MPTTIVITKCFLNASNQALKSFSGICTLEEKILLTKDLSPPTIFEQSL